MAIYDSRDFEDVDLSARFPRRDDIVGIDEWGALIAALRDLVPQAETPEGARAAARELDRFVQLVAGLRPRTAARVFVSHQRDDWKEAERVAWRATEVGYEYWLDVHDPGLAFATRSTLPAPILAVLIAAIIEMGLLNSTHIVAVQTPASQRSHWVPYEFGRAKQRALVSSQSANWFETGTGPDPGGDYLSLAFCAPTEASLKAWYERQPQAAQVTRNTLWPKPYTPRPLPN